MSRIRLRFRREAAPWWWATVAAAAVSICAFVGWRSLGAVSAALAIVAGFAVYAGFSDARTQRIPNTVVLASLGSVGIGVSLKIGFVGESTASVLGGVGIGWLVSGAAFLAVAWLIRPALVGGGDWKLLTALGASIGLVAPLAAMCVLLVATPIALAVSLRDRGRRCVPMAPGLAVGYVVALVLVEAWPNLLGGPK